MVKVIFLNLLRSKYGISEAAVNPGTVDGALAQIRVRHPEIDPRDFAEAVVYVNRVRLSHVRRGREELHDGDEVVLTHFVGGG